MIVVWLFACTIFFCFLVLDRSNNLLRRQIGNIGFQLGWFLQFWLNVYYSFLIQILPRTKLSLIT